MNTPPKKSSPTAAFYDEVWGEYQPDVAVQRAFLARWIGEERIRGADVLDAGCGAGAAACAFKLLGARSVLAVDLSGKSLDRARRLAAQCGVDIEIARENLLEPALLPGRSFDIVHSFGVLHHTGDARRAFDNLAPLVRPGGAFYLALYLRTPLTPCWQALRAVCRRLPLPAQVWLSKALDGVARRVGRKGAARGFDNWRDVLDWFFVPVRSHHAPNEVAGWFRAHGLEPQLLIAATGRLRSTSNFFMRGTKP